MGIIGGADGPTVIFVAATTGGWVALGLLALAAVLLSVGVVCLVKRHKRKQTSTEE